MDLSDWIVPFIIFCVLGFWKLVFIWQSSKKLRPPLPPGPWGLPILGYLPFLNRNASFLSFHQLSRRYGPIYRVKLGLVPVVVVADSDLIKTAFKEEAFSGKPPLYITNGIMRGYGLISADGELWKEQRRFTVSCLRDFGLVKSKLSRAKLEERILHEVHLFLEDIAKLRSEPFDAHRIVRKMLGNLMSSIMFGTRFEDDDEEFISQLDLLDSGSEIVDLAGLLNFLPFLRFLPSFRKSWKRAVTSQSTHHNFLKKIVDKHKLSFISSDSVSDFIDAYLLEMGNRQLRGNVGHFSETQLVHMLADLFGAGVETMKITLKWSFLYLILNPEVQRNAQIEMDRVIGRNRNPNLDDLQHCPYTEAVVLECQRLASVLPLGAPHGTVQNSTLGGYFIPKGTMLLPLLWSVHMDPTKWPQPEKFRPERFLGENGQVFKPDYLMPFSTGRRLCVGEELAKTTLLLTTATILHRFTLCRSEDGSQLDTTPVSTFTSSPKPFQFRAITRD